MSSLLIDFGPEEVDAASSYHGGQSSMLYAVASTGALSRGTVRPYRDGQPLSDDEWAIDLVERLNAEASRAAQLADEQGETDYADHLRAISEACETYLDVQK